MNDRENVVEVLEEISDYFSDIYYKIYYKETESGKRNKAQKYCDAIEDVLELLKEKEPMRVLSQRECETLPNHYERKGFCPKCHQTVEWLLNRSYCGFCVQAVKWND